MSLGARQYKPGARFLDPAVLARIGRLDLLARTVVEGFINGLHRSPFFGASVNFAEHRQYMPGDDIRRLDWKVFLRTDRFYVKEYEADSNANFSCVIDVSRSMSFGSHEVNKIDYARYLAACLTYFSHKQRDRVGIVTFDDRIREFVPPSAKHLDIVLHTLDRIELTGRSALRRPLLKLTEAARRKGIYVVLSDFYREPETVVQALRGLHYRGHDLIVFHILDPAEILFEYDEAANYQDMETGEAIPIVPEKLRQQYRQMIAEHIETISSLLGREQIDYMLLDTSKPLDHALFRYLTFRLNSIQVR